MAHIGVGAFHRAHQAEYTDDLLGFAFDRWGIVGINIREPRLADDLGRQDGLYTRLIRQDDKLEARVIGSILKVVDSQMSPFSALDVLGSSDIDVVTITVTEKGYCHKPSSGELDLRLPDIAHDIAHPEAPRSLPGLILRALEMRKRSHGRPLTALSCDNIPSNGVILGNVVRSLAEHRGPDVRRWIDDNAAFPSAMVDRIAPAVSQADFDTVEHTYGYRDTAVAVGEPFRQWVIENRFADRFPPWDMVGAIFVDDVEPYEHLKMRVLNGAQSSLSYLGVIFGLEHTFDDMADPLLVHFIRRMLIEETLPTLRPIPGIDPTRYVDQCLDRLRNTAIRHRNHQIATDGSQKIVQRLLAPIRERLQRGERFDLLSVAVAAWMVYLIRASDRFGRAWAVEDPFAAVVAGIADRVGQDADALTREIVSIDAIFHPQLAASEPFRRAIVASLRGLLADDPIDYVRNICAMPVLVQLNRMKQTG